MPAILVYVFGLPIFFFVNLRSYHKALAAKDHETAMTIDRQFGFLSTGLDPEFYAWELAIMVRKTIIIFATEYGSSISSEVQVLVAIIICVCNVMLILQFRPMADSFCNRMDVFSQVVQMITLYNGLFYITGADRWYMNPNTGIDWFFMPLILAPSLVFFVLWALSVKT